MICDRCKTNEATMHFANNVGGDQIEYNYCESCAEELKKANDDILSSLFNAFFGSLSNNVLKINFMDNEKTEEEDYCPVCKTTYSEIVKNAKVGCSTCYSHFYNRLAPSIKRIHGETKHIGKVSSSASLDVKKNSEILKLKNELSNFVLLEEYENAAKTRDRINELQEGI